eukprot:jgi/Botrbrau1/4826/Bobra.0325s0040.1
MWRQMETQPLVAVKQLLSGKNCQTVTLELDSVSWALIDDRYGHNIEVISMVLQGVQMRVGRDEAMTGIPASLIARLSVGMHLSFLDSSVDTKEPMIDMWRASIEYRHTGPKSVLSLSSSERLNVMFTSSALRSIGDLRAMVYLLSSPPSQRDTKGAEGLNIEKAWSSVKAPSSLYRLVNKTGMRLSYWTDRTKGQSHIHYVNPSEETSILLNPSEKHVILPDAQQQVRARTINIQLEGNWAPLTDIVIDKVGKYAYTVGNANEGQSTPVVMDVSLDIRTKVLTVHSPYLIENLTAHPLQFSLHLFFARNAARVATSPTPMFPGEGPLMPNTQCYLPVPATWGGVMYLHAIGWQLGKKDKLDLDWQKLRERQGLYSCPPISHNQKPFFCCLEVREDKVKVFNRESTGLDATALWIMRFRAPLVIKNLLPYKIIVVLADTTSGLDAPVFEIGIGASADVYQFDMTRKIRLSIQLKDYKSPRPVIIHYPPSSYMDESLRRSVVGDLPGVRLPREIGLLQDSYVNESPRVFTLQGTRLNLRLLNKGNGSSRAREISIYCPFWIVNKTNLALRIRDTSPQATVPCIALPGLGTIPDPILFSSPSGVVRLSLNQGPWSRPVNLESPGIRGNLHLLAPVNAFDNTSSTAIVDGVVHIVLDAPISSRSAEARKRYFLRTSTRREDTSQRPNSAVHLGVVDEEDHPVSETTSDSKPAGQTLSRIRLGQSMKDDEQGDEDGQSQEWKRYDFAMDAAVGPSIYHQTKVVTISPRYIILNGTAEPLQYGQRDGKHVWEISPNVQAPFYWEAANGKQEMCIRPTRDKWRWSGAFEVEQIGDFGVRVTSPNGHTHRILTVSVSPYGASFQITLRGEKGQPPYRIDNRCENIKIRFQQRDIWPDVWELVSPGQSQEYAWDEILLPHRLRVVFDTEGTPFTDATVHEYNLDIIRVHPLVKLRRVARIGKRGGGTMGRALSVKAIGGMVGRSAASPGTGPGGQPDFDTRNIYVAVHADGPTRILCFSETRLEYSTGTIEEQQDVLASQLKGTYNRLQEIDRAVAGLQHVEPDRRMSLGGRHGPSMLMLSTTPLETSSSLLVGTDSNELEPSTLKQIDMMQLAEVLP